MDDHQPKDHCLRMMSKMYQMRDQPGFCDLSIVVDGKTYWAHKCVLIVACPTLHEIVLRESQTAPKENLQLTLDGLTRKGFEAMLEYIYTGTPPLKADPQLCDDFGKACRALGVSEINGAIENGVKSSTPFVPGENEKLIIEVVTSPPLEDRDIGHHSKVVGRSHDFAVTGIQSRTIQGNLDRTASDVLDDEDDSDYIPDNDDETGGLQESTFDYNIAVSEQDEAIMLENNGEMNALDISALFSVKKRSIRVEENQRATQDEDPSIKSKKNDQDIGIIRRRSRGRPRLPNDHLFPVEPPYVCPHRSCVKVCESREKLKKHYRNHEEKTHPCDFCGKKFLYQKDVIIHRRIHTGEKPYECATCGMRFTQKCILINHMQTHAKGRKFSCRSCGKSYTSARSLGAHIREKHSTPDVPKPTCAACGEAFPNDCPYVKYNESGDAYLICENCADADDEAYRFFCPSCVKTFTYAKSLELHIWEKHTDRISGKPICGFCGDTYFDDGPFLMHRDNGCSDEYHVCLKCGITLNDRSVFQRHIQECVGEFSRLKRKYQSTEFECAICGTHINGRRSAMSHVQFTHNIYPVTDTHVKAVMERRPKKMYVTEEETVVSAKEQVGQKVQIIDLSKIMFEELEEGAES